MCHERKHGHGIRVKSMGSHLSWSFLFFGHIFISKPSKHKIVVSCGTNLLYHWVKNFPLEGEKWVPRALFCVMYHVVITSKLWPMRTSNLLCLANSLFGLNSLFYINIHNCSGMATFYCMKMDVKKNNYKSIIGINHRNYKVLKTLNDSNFAHHQRI